MFFCCTLVPMFGQGLEPDAAGCVDSKIVPKLAGCRIDNCENKDSDRRDVATREDEKGEPVTTVVEGESHSVMYECREGTTPAGIVQQAIALLRSAHFEIPYQFADQEGAITAQKADLWVLLEAASRYYTVTELKAASSVENAFDAADLAEALSAMGTSRLTAWYFQQATRRSRLARRRLCGRLPRCWKTTLNGGSGLTLQPGRNRKPSSHGSPDTASHGQGSNPRVSRANRSSL